MFGKKRKQQLEEYSKLRKRFLTQHRNCVVKPFTRSSRCTQPASQIHHRKGRGKFLLSVATWMPVCPDCHDFIHKHPTWSFRKGYMIKRASKEPVVPFKDLS